MVPHISPVGFTQRGQIRARYKDSLVKEFVGGLLIQTIKKKTGNIRLRSIEWVQGLQGVAAFGRGCSESNVTRWHGGTRP